MQNLEQNEPYMCKLKKDEKEVYVRVVYRGDSIVLMKSNSSGENIYPAVVVEPSSSEARALDIDAYFVRNPRE